MNEKKEYIERNAALRAITGQPSELHYPSWYKGNIMEVPAADVVEVVHGEWIKSKWGYPDRTLTCSVCGFEYDSTDYNTSKFEQKVLPHCPVCTAKMDGGRKEE